METLPGQASFLARQQPFGEADGLWDRARSCGLATSPVSVPGEHPADQGSSTDA